MATAALQSPPRGASPEGAASALRLHIGGMTCATCQGRVERILRKQQGVVSAQVNLVTEVATVAYEPAAIDDAGLVAAVERAGYEAESLDGGAEADTRREANEHRRSRRDLAILFGSVALTLPLVLPMLLAPLGVHWMLPASWQLALATPVQLVAGARFYRAAWGALRSGDSNMDLLVSLGTTAAFGLSLVAMARGEEHLYFEASASVITLVLLGKTLEARARRGTAAAVRALMDLRPVTAVVLRDGREVEIPADAVGRGEQVVVKPGGRVPVDGRLVEGESELDESLLTGEAMPVLKRPGDEVTGGAINGTGRLVVEATRVGEDATVAKIIALVEGAEASKAPIQRLVDRIARVFVPVIVAVAALTFVGWLTFGGLSVAEAAMVAVSVLVIACPCALGLATPTALVAGNGAAARAGVLVQNAQAIEDARTVDVVVFDKTGTVTVGRPEVLEVVALDGDAEALLMLAAAAQAGSEHPLAGAVRRHADERHLALATSSSFTAVPGKGIEATVDGQALVIGSARFLRERGVDLGDLDESIHEQEGQGRTVMVVASEDQAIGAIAVGDELRPGAHEAIARLRADGIRCVLLTGDNRRAAETVGEALGIDEVIAEVLPEDKAAHVQSLRGEGHVVAMVGDGINDAPALAAADLGVAMATGTDVAMHSAAVTLMRPELRLVGDAIDIARATTRKIRQNLFWAFIYNVIGVPLAALGLLSPMVAGAAMAMSSVSVVSNALLLRGYRPKP